jgi:hypothetical protein
MEHVENYDRVVYCVGTNDCCTDTFSGDDFAVKAEELIALAKTKVPEPAAVTLSSIPPRLDTAKKQENVDLANACLASLASKSETTFLNNDSTFKLADGNINDGYLLKDGLHLSRQGSRRLAANMNLMVKTGHDITDGHPPQHRRNAQRDDDQWNTVHGRNSRRRTPGVQNNTGRGCYNCAEKNHTTEQCRHGRRITCSNCHKDGHKAKFCRRN